MKKILLIISSHLIKTCLLLIIATDAIGQGQPIDITVTVVPPVSHFLNQTLSSAGSGVQVRVTNTTRVPYNIRLFGKISSINPTQFSIELNPGFKASVPITVLPNQTLTVTNALLSQAFGNFSEGDLIPRGILSTLRDGPNYRLPEGIYQICFYAKNFNNDTIVSSRVPYPNSFTCSNPFNLCYKASAPQFTQPVNNFNLQSSIATIKPISPVIFTWTTPLATCGLMRASFNYEFEIREILDNQTITDVINNPYVFRKTSLPSTTFLFDVNLYKDVLRPGRRYAIRVRAISTHPTSPILIDNNGYSRIEAFQYGEAPDIVNQSGLFDPEFYFIAFNQRKSNYWDDIFADYVKGLRKDTLVPVKEFIGLKLMQSGLAYNLDAIELFLALNPTLINDKSVNISYVPKLPELPKVSTNNQEKFNLQHTANLKADAAEANRFLRLLDSLNLINRQKAADSSRINVSDLIRSLNSTKAQVNTINRVSMSFINNLLTELLYNLRSNPNRLTNNDYSHLQDIITDLKELSLSATEPLSYNANPAKSFRNLLAVYQYKNTTSFANSTDYPTNLIRAYLPVPGNPLLQFDVVVYRRNIPPAQLVLDAPDLTATYRIFYTLRGLYNYKNPEVNAKTISQLASTTNVSLPLSSVYKFWSLNMLNHNLTKPQDIDIKDLFLKSRKGNSPIKKLTILLKVN